MNSHTATAEEITRLVQENKVLREANLMIEKEKSKLKLKNNELMSLLEYHQRNRDGGF